MGGRVRFFSNWTHEQVGLIHGGGQLRIEYARTRLPSRPWIYVLERFFYNWSITASARFFPGDLAEESRQWRGMGDGMIAFDLDVPHDVDTVELWFRYFDTVDKVEAWDSQHGQNYRFDVVRTLPAAPADSGSTD